MDTPRVAVIGAGRWGRNIIRTLAGDLTQNPQTIAYIAHGGSAETKVFLSERYPIIPTTTDYRTALEDSTVDAVVIATPIATHATIVRDALTAGKHVLCEKPLALSPAEGTELYNLAQEKSRVLMTGYLYLFDSGFTDIRDALSKNNDIDADFVWEKFGSFETPLSENLLVHDLALAHELLDGCTLEQVEQNVTDVLTVVVKGARGKARIHIDRTKEHRVKRLTARTSDTVRTHEWTRNDLLDIEVDTFLAKIKGGTPDNKKQQRIDESIAAVLEVLPQPS